MQQQNNGTPWGLAALALAGLGLTVTANIYHGIYCNAEQRRVEGSVIRVERRNSPAGTTGVVHSFTEYTLSDGTVFTANSDSIHLMQPSTPDINYRIGDHARVRINRCDELVGVETPTERR